MDAQTNQTYPMNRPGMTMFGLFIALGLIVGGWLLGAQIKATRLSDRYVTVKGLSERNVKSDLAIWSIGYKDAGDDLSLLYAKAETDKNAILQFLSRQGIQPSEIGLGVVSVVDTQANEYGNNNRAPHRYIVNQEITVRTSRVDQVAAAAQKTVQLLEAGIVLNGRRGEGVTYKFTGLNSIKLDMIAEATRNARNAANRFAADSGSKVGSIRQANQGIISISAANSGSSDAGESGYGNFDDNSSLMKTVRVVSSIEYYLEK